MSPSSLPPRRRIRYALLALAASGSLVLAGCAGGGTAVGGGAAAPSDTLTLGSQAAPGGMSPTQNANAYMTAPAYDSLVYAAPDGSLQPWLATSWAYVGTGNTVFDLTLRSGVTFADGSAMDATAVKNSIDYFRSAPGPNATKARAIADVAVRDAQTVRVTFATPYPNAPFLFSQSNFVGSIIGPKGIADPDSLNTSSDGVGAYQLVPEGTATGSQYTFTATPNYWNPPAQHYRRLVIKIIADPNAMVSALQTGQIDVGTGVESTVATAEAAGLTVASAPAGWWSLVLADRGGESVPALGDVRVRQAINYAIDRSALAAAITNGIGAAVDQPATPGTESADPSSPQTYPYDPAKAKELLAQAGYPDGFTMSLADSALDVNSVVGQAVIGDLGKVGITVTLNPVSGGVPPFIQAVLGRTDPAFVWAPVNQPAFEALSQLTAPTGNYLNPFGTVDPSIDTQLATAAAAADEPERVALYQQVTKALTDQAWFAPLFSRSFVYYVRAGVQGVDISAAYPHATPVGPTAETSWRPAG